jgi:hypothetical protein
MATLAEIRAKLQQTAQSNSNITSGDNAIFPHWNIAEGTTTTVRFLPDKDSNNTFFWVERAMIKLPFAGIKGEVNSKPITVQVPCMEMWNESCPILTEVRPWFKDKSLEDMGRKYWKKKSYLFQGFVVNTDLKEDKLPENPIRRFIIGSQIFNIVKNALMDSEIEELPTDYIRGLDFKITKSGKGGYADYNTSTWARRERALSESEMSAIQQYGLWNLQDFLPKKPTEVELKVIKEMFEASVDGEAYDPDRWANYFKPSGAVNLSSGVPKSVTNQASAKPAVSAPSGLDDEEPPFEPETKSAVKEDKPSGANEASNRAADIIAMIRKRQAQ